MRRQQPSAACNSCSNSNTPCVDCGDNLWSWSDNSTQPADGGYSNWINSDAYKWRDQQCAYTTMAGAWHASDCSGLFGAICKNGKIIRYLLLFRLLNIVLTIPEAHLWYSLTYAARIHYNNTFCNNDVISCSILRHTNGNDSVLQRLTVTSTNAHNRCINASTEHVATLTAATRATALSVTGVATANFQTSFRCRHPLVIKAYPQVKIIGKMEEYTPIPTPYRFLNLCHC